MCKWGDTVPMILNGRLRGIDSCIANIIAALNLKGISTKASCCGHHKALGLISLQDGRQLVIYNDLKTALKAVG